MELSNDSPRMSVSGGDPLMEDYLTILTNLPGAGGISNAATKTLSLNHEGKWLKSNQYKLSRQFFWSTMPVSDVFSMHEALLRVSHNPTSFVIRGQLKEDVDITKPVYRRCHKKNNDTAHFKEIPRHWLMLDFDKVSVSEWSDLFVDPESAVEDLIYRHLPNLFCDVSCVWQLSSGAGTSDPDGTLSLHLWFWLDRPMCKEELDVFCVLHASAVDRAVFGTVQPLYTAAPVFQNQCDPLPRRIGLMQREYDFLTLPSVDVKAIRCGIPAGFSTGLIGHVRGFEAKLKLLGDGQGLNGFNSVIPAAIAAYVSKRHKHELCGDTIKANIRNAVDRAPVSADRSQQDLIRYKSDQYLDECIHTAIAKFCLQSVTPLYPEPITPIANVKKSSWSNINAFIDSEVERLTA